MRGAGSGSRGGFNEFQMKRTRRKLKDLWDACAIDDAYACDNCAPDARVKGAKYKAYVALPFKYGVGVVMKDNGQLSDSLFIVPFRDVSKYHRQITQEDKGSFNAVSCKSNIIEVIHYIDIPEQILHDIKNFWGRNEKRNRKEKVRDVNFR
jgi:hypothetical protein